MAMEDWAEIVLQAGLAHDKITVEEIYELATRVMHDEVVSQRRLENARAHKATNTWPVLYEMTAEELSELRQRIGGVAKPKTFSKEK
jgi:hypothetical protein